MNVLSMKSSSVFELIGNGNKGLVLIVDIIHEFNLVVTRGKWTVWWNPERTFTYLGSKEFFLSERSLGLNWLEWLDNKDTSYQPTSQCILWIEIKCQVSWLLSTEEHNILIFQRREKLCFEIGLISISAFIQWARNHQGTAPYLINGEIVGMDFEYKIELDVPGKIKRAGKLWS